MKLLTVTGISTNEFPPKFRDEGSQCTVAKENCSATLSAALYDMNKDTEIEWTKDGGPLPPETQRRRLRITGNLVQLTLDNVQKDDAGLYRVSAKSPTGLATRDLELRISSSSSSSEIQEDEPPAFLRRLNDLSVKVGTRTRFLVEIKSATDLIVEWFHNEEPVEDGDERTRKVSEGGFFCLDVAPVIAQDTGRWTCTARNSSGQASSTSHLNVLVPKTYKPPEFHEELRALLTEQGTVSLECKVVGVPAPFLRWFKDGREIRAGDVFALTADPDDPKSLGTYVCEATNCMGKAVSISKLHVVEKDARTRLEKIPFGPPPTFETHLKDESITIGEPLSLSCRVTVPPWPKCIAWYNSEGKVEENATENGGRYKQLADGLGGYFLEIKPSEACDQGEWKCVAVSQQDSISISRCHVKMTIPKYFKKPRFMDSLKAVLTDEGLVSFECKVVGSPTPLLRWFKDGQELRPGDVYLLTGTNSLGSYCCIAKNCMGEARSSAELTVEDIQSQLSDEERAQLLSKSRAPKILHGLKSVEVKINEAHRFSVQVSVTTPLEQIAWYRDDNAIENESDRCVPIRENLGVHHLDIMRVEWMDQAEWKFVATNEFGHSVTTCFLKVLIPKHYKKPKFLENLRAVLSEEGAVNLECKVIGVPQPVLTWYKDGIELKPGDIHRITSGEGGTCCLGTYTCEARNCMGTVASSASLLGYEDQQQKTRAASRMELARVPSLSTIHEERTSQLYGTAQGDDERSGTGEMSFSFDGKDVSVSLYETPDLTQDEAIQIVEMYADQLSEHISEQNVVELPSLRFVKNSSNSANLVMEAVVVDVTEDYFTPGDQEDDLRTEADVDDMFSITENIKSERLEIEIEEPPKRPPRKSDSKSNNSFHSFSKNYSFASEGAEETESMAAALEPDTESLIEDYESAHCSAAETSSLPEKFSDDGDGGRRPLTPRTAHEIGSDLRVNRSSESSQTKRKPRRSSSQSSRSSGGISNENQRDLQGEEGDGLIVDMELNKSKQLELKIEQKALISELKCTISDIKVGLKGVEHEIFVASFSKHSPTASDRSIELLNGIITPLNDIETIFESANFSIVELVAPPIFELQKALILLEKCMEIQGRDHTIVQKTCTNVLDSVAPQITNMLALVEQITLIEKELEVNAGRTTPSKIAREVCITLKEMNEALERSDGILRNKIENDSSSTSSISTGASVGEDTEILKRLYASSLELKRSLEDLEKIVAYEDPDELYTSVRQPIIDKLAQPLNDLEKQLEIIRKQSIKCASNPKSLIQELRLILLHKLTPAFDELAENYQAIIELNPSTERYSGMVNVSLLESFVNPTLEILNCLENLRRSLNTTEIATTKSTNLEESTTTTTTMNEEVEEVFDVVGKMVSSNITKLVEDFLFNIETAQRNVINTESLEALRQLTTLQKDFAQISSKIQRASFSESSIAALENLAQPLQILNSQLSETCNNFIEDITVSLAILEESIQVEGANENLTQILTNFKERVGKVKTNISGLISEEPPISEPSTSSSVVLVLENVPDSVVTDETVQDTRSLIEILENQCSNSNLNVENLTPSLEALDEILHDSNLVKRTCELSLKQRLELQKYVQSLEYIEDQVIESLDSLLDDNPSENREIKTVLEHLQYNVAVLRQRVVDESNFVEMKRTNFDDLKRCIQNTIENLPSISEEDESMETLVSAETSRAILESVFELEKCLASACTETSETPEQEFLSELNQRVRDSFQELKLTNVVTGDDVKKLRKLSEPLQRFNETFSSVSRRKSERTEIFESLLENLNDTKNFTRNVSLEPWKNVLKNELQVPLDELIEIVELEQNNLEITELESLGKLDELMVAIKDELISVVSGKSMEILHEILSQLEVVCNEDGNEESNSRFIRIALKNCGNSLKEVLNQISTTKCEAEECEPIGEPEESTRRIATFDEISSRNARVTVENVQSVQLIAGGEPTELVEAEEKAEAEETVDRIKDKTDERKRTELREIVEKIAEISNSISAEPEIKRAVGAINVQLLDDLSKLSSGDLIFIQHLHNFVKSFSENDADNLEDALAKLRESASSSNEHAMNLCENALTTFQGIQNKREHLEKLEKILESTRRSLKTMDSAKLDELDEIIGGLSEAMCAMNLEIHTENERKSIECSMKTLTEISNHIRNVHEEDANSNRTKVAIENLKVSIVALKENSNFKSTMEIFEETLKNVVNFLEAVPTRGYLKTKHSVLGNCANTREVINSFDSSKLNRKRRVILVEILKNLSEVNGIVQNTNFGGPEESCCLNTLNNFLDESREFIESLSSTNERIETPRVNELDDSVGALRENSAMKNLPDRALRIAEGLKVFLESFSEDADEVENELQNLQVKLNNFRNVLHCRENDSTLLEISNELHLGLTTLQFVISGFIDDERKNVNSAEMQILTSIGDNFDELANALPERIEEIREEKLQFLDELVGNFQKASESINRESSAKDFIEPLHEISFKLKRIGEKCKKKFVEFDMERGRLQCKLVEELNQLRRVSDMQVSNIIETVQNEPGISKKELETLLCSIEKTNIEFTNFPNRIEENLTSLRANLDVMVSKDFQSDELLKKLHEFQVETEESLEKLSKSKETETLRKMNCSLSNLMDLIGKTRGNDLDILNCLREPISDLQNSLEKGGAVNAEETELISSLVEANENLEKLFESKTNFEEFSDGLYELENVLISACLKAVLNSDRSGEKSLIQNILPSLDSMAKMVINVQNEYSFRKQLRENLHELSENLDKLAGNRNENLHLAAAKIKSAIDNFTIGNLDIDLRPHLEEISKIHVGPPLEKQINFLDELRAASDVLMENPSPDVVLEKICEISQILDQLSRFSCGEKGAEVEEVPQNILTDGNAEEKLVETASGTDRILVTEGPKTEEENGRNEEVEPSTTLGELLEKAALPEEVTEAGTLDKSQRKTTISESSSVETDNRMDLLGPEAKLKENLSVDEKIEHLEEVTEKNVDLQRLKIEECLDNYISSVENSTDYLSSRNLSFLDEPFLILIDSLKHLSSLVKDNNVPNITIEQVENLQSFFGKFNRLSTENLNEFKESLETLISSKDEITELIIASLTLVNFKLETEAEKDRNQKGTEEINTSEKLERIALRLQKSRALLVELCDNEETKKIHIENVELPRQKHAVAANVETANLEELKMSLVQHSTLAGEENQPLQATISGIEKEEYLDRVLVKITEIQENLNKLEAADVRENVHQGVLNFIQLSAPLEQLKEGIQRLEELKLEEQAVIKGETLEKLKEIESPLEKLCPILTRIENCLQKSQLSKLTIAEVQNALVSVKETAELVVGNLPETNSIKLVSSPLDALRKTISNIENNLRGYETRIELETVDEFDPKKKIASKMVVDIDRVQENLRQLTYVEINEESKQGVLSLIELLEPLSQMRDGIKAIENVEQVGVTLEKLQEINGPLERLSPVLGRLEESLRKSDVSEVLVPELKNAISALKSTAENVENQISKLEFTQIQIEPLKSLQKANLSIVESNKNADESPMNIGKIEDELIPISSSDIGKIPSVSNLSTLSEVKGSIEIAESTVHDENVEETLEKMEKLTRPLVELDSIIQSFKPTKFKLETEKVMLPELHSALLAFKETLIKVSVQTPSVGKLEIHLQEPLKKLTAELSEIEIKPKYEEKKSRFDVKCVENLISNFDQLELNILDLTRLSEEIQAANLDMKILFQLLSYTKNVQELLSVAMEVGQNGNVEDISSETHEDFKNFNDSFKCLNLHLNNVASNSNFPTIFANVLNQHYDVIFKFKQKFDRMIKMYPETETLEIILNALGTLKSIFADVLDQAKLSKIQRRNDVQLLRSFEETIENSRNAIGKFGKLNKLLQPHSILLETMRDVRSDFTAAYSEILKQEDVSSEVYQEIEERLRNFESVLKRLDETASLPENLKEFRLHMKMLKSTKNTEFLEPLDLPIDAMIKAIDGILWFEKQKLEEIEDELEKAVEIEAKKVTENDSVGVDTAVVDQNDVATQKLEKPNEKIVELTEDALPIEETKTDQLLKSPSEEIDRMEAVGQCENLMGDKQDVIIRDLPEKSLETRPEDVEESTGKSLGNNNQGEEEKEKVAVDELELIPEDKPKPAEKEEVDEKKRRLSKDEKAVPEKQAASEESPKSRSAKEEITQELVESAQENEPVLVENLEEHPVEKKLDKEDHDEFLKEKIVSKSKQKKQQIRVEESENIICEKPGREIEENVSVIQNDKVEDSKEEKTEVQDGLPEAETNEQIQEAKIPEDLDQENKVEKSEQVCEKPDELNSEESGEEIDKKLQSEGEMRKAKKTEKTDGKYDVKEETIQERSIVKLPEEGKSLDQPTRQIRVDVSERIRRNQESKNTDELKSVKIAGKIQAEEGKPTITTTEKLEEISDVNQQKTVEKTIHVQPEDKSTPEEINHQIISEKSEQIPERRESKDNVELIADKRMKTDEKSTGEKKKRVKKIAKAEKIERVDGKPDKIVIQPDNRNGNETGTKIECENDNFKSKIESNVEFIHSSKSELVEELEETNEMPEQLIVEMVDAKSKKSGLNSTLHHNEPEEKLETKSTKTRDIPPRIPRVEVDQTTKLYRSSIEDTLLQLEEKPKVDRIVDEEKLKMKRTSATFTGKENFDTMPSAPKPYFGERSTDKSPTFSSCLFDKETTVATSRIVLTCTVLMPENVIVKWYKNGRLLKLEDRKISTSFNNYTGVAELTLTNLVEEDSAEYSCVAENEHGKTTTRSRLNVNSCGKEMASRKTATTFTEHLGDDELSLQCRVKCTNPHFVKCYKDDETISLDGRHVLNYLDDGIAKLSIQEPSRKDYGIYTCEVTSSGAGSSGVGVSEKISHSLDKSSFENQNRNQSFNSNYGFSRPDIQLQFPKNDSSDVELRSYGPTKTVEPLKVHHSFEEKAAVTPKFSNNSTEERGKSSNGKCTDTREGPRGKIEATTTVVQDGKPPMFISRPDKILSVRLGEDVSVSFRIGGDPKPKLILTKGLSDITETSKCFKETSDDYNRFTLKSLVEKDMGTYCVLAKNARGCDRAFFTLTLRPRARSETPTRDNDNFSCGFAYSGSSLNVSDCSDRTTYSYFRDAPGAVSEPPRVVDSGKNWISLSWGKPDPSPSAAPVIAYKIESWLHGPEGDARWTELGISPINSYDAFNLKPGGLYRFRVTPRNRYGWGEPVQTSETIPVGDADGLPEFVQILPSQIRGLIGSNITIECSLKDASTSSSSSPIVRWYKNSCEIVENERYEMIRIDNTRCALTITSLRYSDEGRFICEATNRAGSVSTFSRLSVVDDENVVAADKNLKLFISDFKGPKAHPPQFTMRLRDRTVPISHPVRLTCQTVAFPSAAVKWFKDNIEIRESERCTFWNDDQFHTLEIAKTVSEDTGIYTLMASNEHGTVSCKSALTIDQGTNSSRYMAPQFKSALSVQPEKLYEGDELKIFAKIDAYPNVLVAWYKDGVRLRNSRRSCMNLSKDGSLELTIAHVTSKDGGIYSCVASNDVGKVESSATVEIGKEKSAISTKLTENKSGSVKSSKEPKFLKKPRSFEAFEGDNVVILCEIIGDPEPEVIWFRDFLKPDYYRDAPRFKRADQGSEYRLEIPDAKIDFTGTYTVYAKNVHGDAKAIISLQIKAKDDRKKTGNSDLKMSNFQTFPTFKRDLRDIRCCDGDAITFECEIEKSSPEGDINIEWKKGGKLIRLGDADGDFETSFDGAIARLSIKQVYPEDEGEYTCSVSNELGNAKTSACLIVDIPENEQHQQLLLNPVLNDAEEIKSNSSIRASSYRETVKVQRIRPPIRYDNCPIKSSLKAAPPKFYTIPHNRVAEVGETVKFQCAVSGFPDPYTCWEKDGISVTPSHKITISELDDLRVLEIANVSKSDSGTYKIILENRVGKIEASAKLDVVLHRNYRAVGSKTRARSLSPRVSSYHGRSVNVGSRISSLYNSRLRADIRNVPTPFLKWYSDKIEQVRVGFGFSKFPVPALCKLGETAPFCARFPREKCRLVRKINALTLVENSEKYKVEERRDVSVLRISDVGRGDVNGKVKCLLVLLEQQQQQQQSHSGGDLVRSRTVEDHVDFVRVSEKINSAKLVDFCETELNVFHSLDFDMFPNEGKDDDGKCEAAVLLRGPKDTTALVGDRVLLKATFTGHPEPRVKWSKAGRVLMNDGKTSITFGDGVSCLLLQDITTDDSGKYDVSIENECGSDFSFASVSVEGPPDPPSGKPSITVSSDSVTVAWSSSPYDGGRIVTGFAVDYRRLYEDEDEDVWTTITDNCHSLSLTLKGFLRPGARYKFRVRAQNVHGYSKPGLESDVLQLDEMTSEISTFEPRTVSLEPGPEFKARYEILEELGKGRFGVVHKVVDKITRQKLAAKFIRCRTAKDRDKVQDEIDIMNQLRHQKLLQLAAAFENPREMIMIMEYISGGELFERVVADDFTLTEKDCILFVQQICEGVDYMHSQEIVHLDLKPENIMCHTRTSHEIKIIDFGLAQKLDPTKPTRVLFGTPEFIPPEIINYEVIGLKSDMWSIGVICYVLLSGLSPFMGENDAETFANITRADYDFDDEAFNAVSQNARDFIAALLIKRKEERLSAAECLRHTWLDLENHDNPDVVLSTDKLKKFIIRRKWQKTGNAIRALGRMATLSASRRNSANNNNNNSGNNSTPTTPRASLTLTANSLSTTARMSSSDEGNANTNADDEANAEEFRKHQHLSEEVTIIEEEEIDLNDSSSPKSVKSRSCTERSDSGISCSSHLTTSSCQSTPLLGKKISISEEPEMLFERKPTTDILTGSEESSNQCNGNSSSKTLKIHVNGNGKIITKGKLDVKIETFENGNGKSSSTSSSSGLKKTPMYSAYTSRTVASAIKKFDRLDTTTTTATTATRPQIKITPSQPVDSSSPSSKISRSSRSPLREPRNSEVIDSAKLKIGNNGRSRSHSPSFSKTTQTLINRVRNSTISQTRLNNSNSSIPDSKMTS